MKQIFVFKGESPTLSVLVSTGECFFKSCWGGESVISLLKSTIKKFFV